MNLDLRFPKGDHGFYLPDIKSWNVAAEDSFRWMKAGWKLMGSVEDLVRERPDELENFARFSYLMGRIFRGGVIHRRICDLGDSKEYWLEIWPDANYPKTVLRETPEVVDNRYRLSNPRIKECYRLKDFERGTGNITDVVIAQWNVVNRDRFLGFKPVSLEREIPPVYVHGEGVTPYGRGDVSPFD